MDHSIAISAINDFLFCPHSLFLSSVYHAFHTDMYHEVPQKNGVIAHENIEHSTYSTQKRYIQGKRIYSEKYGLVGKIDIYDSNTASLIERKYLVKRVQLGHIYQLWAQFLCMVEMGYEVKNLFIHSLKNNTRYSVAKPKDTELVMFEKLLLKIRNYRALGVNVANPQKCQTCIYRHLCHYHDLTN